MTTLEGHKLFKYMGTSDKTGLLECVKDSMSEKRFYPKVTTNQIVQHCIAGTEIPEEDVDPAWGMCPLLETDVCPVYEARPFGCRCLVSEHDCGNTGFAGIDPYILTINDIFLQHIEHLDHQGMTGNLSDVLVFIQAETRRSSSQHTISIPDNLIRNHQIRALMIPPEYRNRVSPILESLRAILA